MSEPQLVVAVQWKQNGVRTFIASNHGSLYWTVMIRAALRVSSPERFAARVRGNRELREALSEWKAMTLAEAKAWKASWPEERPLKLVDIPPWPDTVELVGSE